MDYSISIIINKVNSMIFRRRLKFTSTPTAEMRAPLEDDFHSLRVSIRHAQGLVPRCARYAVTFSLIQAVQRRRSALQSADWACRL